MKMKSIATVSLVVILSVLLSFAGSTWQADDPGVLLRAGIEKEEVDGDLQGAIDMYKQIIERHSSNHAIAAKAQLRIGMCYEKLGLREAQNAYQRVIENYPQQQEEVKLAKERLSQLSKALAAAPGKPKFRKIRIPANPGNGVLSPDGKKLAFVAEGGVWKVSIQGNVEPDLAGEAIRLTEPMDALAATAWSGDGKWIAFIGSGENKEVISIYIVSSSGGEPKRIGIGFDPGSHLYGCHVGISPDGDFVAFSAAKDTGSPKMKSGEKSPISQFIYTKHVKKGEAKQLMDSPAWQPAFSLDGKKLAFVKPFYLESDSKVQSDLWIVDSDGSNPVRVTDFPGNLRGPVWSPDGNMIACNHEPGGTNSSQEVWIIPVADGEKLDVSPTKIKLPLETYSFIVGWSSDNKIGLFLRNPSHRAVYTIPRAGGKATQITPGASDSELKKDRGYPIYPKWSPDGKKVFLRWGGGNIATVPSQGGKMTIVHSREDTKIIPIVPGGGCDVSPDGKSIVSAIYKSDKRPFKFSIWTMQTEGGEAKHIAQNFIPDRHPCWSPDGKQIAFIRYIKNGGEPNIYTTSQDGEQIRKITSASDSVAEASIDWSPDGKHIAYLSKNKSINIVSIEGEEVRTIAEVNTLDGALAWSPKGDEIAYTSGARIWIMSVEGGESREVQTGLTGKVYGTIDWSPDGKKIIFTAASGGDRELWLMEDFLHLVKGRK